MRSTIIRAYVTRAERRRFDKAAAEAGLTLSNYLRSLFGLDEIEERQGGAGVFAPTGSRPSVRFRVDDAEYAIIEREAEGLELSIPNAVRVLGGLEASRTGAPEGNQNHAGKAGGNQYTRKPD